MNFKMAYGLNFDAMFERRMSAVSQGLPGGGAGLPYA